MLITREADYALRILRTLANGAQQTAPQICQEEQIPDKFVYKIAKKLERAGMIQITRGAEGGCRLVADLHRVSLYDLMEALGADRLVNACMQPGYCCNWQGIHTRPCEVHLQLQQIQDKIDGLLREYSLYGLLYGPEQACSRRDCPNCR